MGHLCKIPIISYRSIKRNKATHIGRYTHNLHSYGNMMHQDEVLLTAWVMLCRPPTLTSVSKNKPFCKDKIKTKISLLQIYCIIMKDSIIQVDNMPRNRRKKQSEILYQILWDILPAPLFPCHFLHPDYYHTLHSILINYNRQQ